MKRTILGLWILILVILLVGCTQKESKSKNSKKEEVSVENEDAEVNIKKENNSTSTPSKDESDTKKSQESVLSDKQLEITDAIKKDLVVLAPGLFDYNSSKSKKIKDESKFKFIYYGYGMNDYSKYRKVTKNLEGTITNWIMIPEKEVNQRFFNAFGLEIGNYEPKLNEFSPTIYKAKGYYYLCIDEKPSDGTYSFVDAKKDGKGYSVTIKETTPGEERYNEYLIKINAANNSNGYVITNVSVVPR